MVQMNVTKADVWWVTCQHSDCDFATKKTPDQDKAQRWRLAHFRHHEKEQRHADEVEDLAQILRRVTPGMAHPDAGDYGLAVCRDYARAAIDAGWRKIAATGGTP